MFIRGYDGTTYLTLFYTEKYDSIFDRIRCTIVLKSGITYAYSYNYAELGWWFACCKNLDYACRVVLIKSGLNKNHNEYYYKIFSEKCSYYLAKKQWQKLFLIV